MNQIIKLSLVSILALSANLMADVSSDSQAATQAAAEAATKTTDVEGQYSSNSTVKEATKELVQSLNLGFANASGNADSTMFNMKYIATQTFEGINEKELRSAFDASGYYNKVDDAKATEEYIVNLGIEQDIIDGWFGYGTANWYKNEALGFKNKTSIGLGVGKTLFSNEVDTLRVKFGLAYNIADFAEINGVAATGDDNYGTLNQYIEYTRVLNETSNFYTKLGASENLQEFSDLEGILALGLNFSVANNISVSIEESIKYNGLSAFDNILDSKSDTKTIVRIGYSF